MNPYSKGLRGYPAGGGMVGVANEDIYESAAPPSAGKSYVDPESAKALAGALKTKLNPPPTAGPVSSPQFSSVGGISSAPTAQPMTGLSAPASSGGGGWGSTMAKAGPWAALAAAVVANESKQQGDGNRGNSTGEHIGDMASGKVLERDAERYLPHNSAGKAGKRALMMSTPSGLARNLKDFGKWAKGIF